MSTPEHHHNPYPWLSPFYDPMAALLLLPFGGEGRFRDRALDALEVKRGHQVLELGVGTGSMTERLVARGADVLGLELSPHMLARAKRRAPEAVLVEGDMLTFDEHPHTFDRALISFVLHEVGEDVQRGALATAHRSLKKGGLLGIVDFARPHKRVFRRGLRGYLKLSEPKVARRFLQAPLAAILDDAGFSVVKDRRLAQGTARVLVARAR